MLSMSIFCMFHNFYIYTGLLLNTQNICGNVRREKKMTAKLFPQFLYPNSQEYDPTDIEKSVLTRHLMLYVSYFCIFDNHNILTSSFRWQNICCKGQVWLSSVQDTTEVNEEMLHWWDYSPLLHILSLILLSRLVIKLLIPFMFLILIGYMHIRHTLPFCPRISGPLLMMFLIIVRSTGMSLIYLTMKRVQISLICITSKYFGSMTKVFQITNFFHQPHFWKC